MKSGIRKKLSKKTPSLKIMKQISGNTGLSQIYTNHGVRTSTVTHSYQTGVDAQ